MSHDQPTNEVEIRQVPTVSSFRERLAKRVGDRAQEEAQQLANNVVDIATGTAGKRAGSGKSTGNGKGGGKAASTKPSGPPMSLRCARWFFGHGMDGMKLSAEARGKNIAVRAWNGTYWQEMFEETAKPKIQRWLEQFEENSCTPYTVSSTWTTLVNKILAERTWRTDRPDENHTVVLPFKKGYLHVTAEKAWMEEPNPNYGIKHCADVDLGLKPGAVFQPQPIPSDSQFGRYLASSLSDPEVRTVVQQHCAMSFMKNRWQLVGWWVSAGGAGKGSMVKMLHHVHGRDNMGRTNYGSINLTKLDGDHYLETIVDKTFLSCGEVDVTRPWCEDTWKMLVAGDSVDINPKREKLFSYVCEAFMIVNSNQNPVIRDESGGVMRRLQVVLWDGSLERRGTITYDIDKIVFEQEPHLLVGWLVEGIQKILRNGGPVRDKALPDSIRRFTQRLTKDNDSVEAWIQDCSIVRSRDPGVQIRKREIYDHYAEYCQEACIDRPRGEAVFWKILARKMGVNMDDISERRTLPGGGKEQAIVRTIAIRPQDIAREQMERLAEGAIQAGRYREEPAQDDPFGVGPDDVKAKMGGAMIRLPEYNAEEQVKLDHWRAVLVNTATR